MFLAVSACYLVGYAGLLVAPYALAIPCAILIGVGTCTFALVLTLIGLRARTPDGTAALSGFSQSSGYLLAALGPFAVGALHDATGSWTAPLLLLLALALPLMSLAVRVARPAAIEDELARSVLSVRWSELDRTELRRSKPWSSGHRWSSSDSPPRSADGS